MSSGQDLLRLLNGGKTGTASGNTGRSSGGQTKSASWTGSAPENGTGADLIAILNGRNTGSKTIGNVTSQTRQNTTSAKTSGFTNLFADVQKLIDADKARASQKTTATTGTRNRLYQEDEEQKQGSAALTTANTRGTVTPNASLMNYNLGGQNTQTDPLGTRTLNLSGLTASEAEQAGKDTMISGMENSSLYRMFNTAYQAYAGEDRTLKQSAAQNTVDQLQTRRDAAWKALMNSASVEEQTERRAALGALDRQLGQAQRVRDNATGTVLSDREQENVRTYLRQANAILADENATAEEKAVANMFHTRFSNLLASNGGAANAALYTAGMAVSGAESSVNSMLAGTTQTLGDLATGGDYSSGFQKLEQYFQQHPLDTTISNGYDIRYDTAGIAQKTGVDEAVVDAYVQARANEDRLSYNDEVLGRNVSDTYKKWAGETVYTAAQQLPSIMMTAGAGAGEAALSKAVATAYMSLTAANSKLAENARIYGYDPKNYSNAVLNGLAEGLTEYMFGFTDAPSFLKNFEGTGNVAGSIANGVYEQALDVLGEGLEEVVNVPLEGLIDKAYYDPDKAWIGEGGVFDFGAMLDSGVKGALVGGLMGGVASVGGIYNAWQESKNVRTAIEDLNRVARSMDVQYRPAEADPNTATAETVDQYAADILDGFYQQEQEELRKAILTAWQTAEAERAAANAPTQVVSAYMSTDGGTQAPNASSPGNTSDTSLASSPSAEASAGGSTDQVLNMPDQNQTRSHTPEAPHGAHTSTTPDIAQTGQDVNAPRNENGLVAYTEQEQINLSSGKKNVLIRKASELKSFILNALRNNNNTERAYLGKLSNDVARRIQKETGLDVSGYSAILLGDNIRHIFKNHGDPIVETARGQIAVTPDVLESIPQVLADPDLVYLTGREDSSGRKAIIFEKEIGDNYITVQGVSNGKRALVTDTFYVQKKKNSQVVPTDARMSDPGDNAQKRIPLSSSNPDISQTRQDVNGQNLEQRTVDGVVMLPGAIVPGAGQTGASGVQLSPAVQSRVDQALELRRQGATNTDIYNATGLVSLNNGDLENGFGGDIVWTEKNHDRRGERSSSEALYGDGGGSLGTGISAVQGSQQARGGSEGNLDVRGSHAKKWGDLGAAERGAVTETIRRNLNVSEAEDLLALYDNGVEGFAQAVYEEYLENPFLVEAEYSAFFHDTAQMLRELGAVLQTPTLAAENPAVARKEGGAVETWEHARQRQGRTSQSYKSEAAAYGRGTLNDIARTYAAERTETDEAGNVLWEGPSDVNVKNRSRAREYYKYVPRTVEEWDSYIQENLRDQAEDFRQENPDMTEAQAEYLAYRQTMDDLMEKAKTGQTLDAYDTRAALAVQDYLIGLWNMEQNESVNLDDLGIPELKRDAMSKIANLYLEFSRMFKQQGTETAQALKARDRGLRGNGVRDSLTNEASEILQQAMDQKRSKVDRKTYTEVLGQIVNYGTRIQRAQITEPLSLKALESSVSDGTITQNELDFLRMTQYTNSDRSLQNERDAILDKLDPQTRETYDRSMERENEAREALIGIIQDISTARKTNSLIDMDSEVSRTLQNALAQQSYDWLSAFAQQQATEIARDYVRPGMDQKLRTMQVLAHLFNIKTILRNIGGNTVFSGLDTVASNSVVPLDMLLARRTGQRSVTIDQSRLSRQKQAGIRDAGLKAYIQTALDVNLDNAKNRMEQSQSRTYKAINGPASAFFGSMEKWLGYGLNVTDARAKGGAYAEALRGLYELRDRGLLRADTTDAELQKLAQEEALYRTFQDDNLATKVTTSLVRGANLGKQFGVGSLVVPYAKTPTNLILRGFDYSPAGLAKGIGQMAYVLAKGKNATIAQQRAAVQSLGRGVTGTALIAAFAALRMLGVIKTSGDEEDKNLKGMNAAAGQSGTQLNISALLRVIRGEDAGEWQDGDILLGVSWLEPINAQMAIGTALGEEWLASGENFNIEAAAGNTLEGLLANLKEMPALTSISNIVDAYNYSDAEEDWKKVGDALLTFAAGIPSSFVPAFVRQAAQASDNNYRDIYGADTGSWVSDTLETGARQVMNNIPGLRQMLPTKQDNFGRDKTYTGNTALNMLNTFLNPGSISAYQTTEGEDELRRVAALTGDFAIIPNRYAENSITYDGVKTVLNEEQKRQWMQVYGDTYYRLIENCLESSYYKGLSASVQSDVLEDAKAYAMDAARRAVLGDYESERMYNIETLDECGLDFSDYSKWKSTVSAYSGDTKEENILRALERSGLTEDQRAAVYTTVTGYSAISDEAEADARRAGVTDEIAALWRYRHDLIDQEDMSKKEKWRQFSEELNASSLTAAQKTYLNEHMKFVSLVPATQDVDFTSDDTYNVTSLSDSGEARWTWAQDEGLSAERWNEIYNEYSSGYKKDAIIASLQAVYGYSESKAERIYQVIKWDTEKLG